MAYKVFQNGTALTAEVMNDFIQEQTIARFANATERNSAMPNPEVGQHVYLTSTNQTLRWEGSIWVELMSTQLSGLTQRPLVVCSSTTRPAMAAGRMIYEADTGVTRVTNGTAWLKVAGPPELLAHTSSTGATGSPQVQTWTTVRQISVPAHNPGILRCQLVGVWSASGSQACSWRLMYNSTVVPGSETRSHNNGTNATNAPVTTVPEGLISTTGAAGTLYLQMIIEQSVTTILVDGTFRVWLQ